MAKAAAPTRERQVELYAMRVDAELLERLQRLCGVTGASMAWHRRRALEMYLDEEEAARDH